MERVISAFQFGGVVALAMAAAIVMTGCSTPEVRTIVVPAERIHVNRPQLPVETLPDTANAAEVFSAYEQSLMLCIGYAKQLEAANK